MLAVKPTVFPSLLPACDYQDVSHPNDMSALKHHLLLDKIYSVLGANIRTLKRW